ncbi:hypothetical protein [Pseudoxanthomonas sp.]|uniref:hypothetical protein n=1 Tax=Pseudoxanthomonas sp. TaxID=1871049 RepID=UPI00262F4009|nr:hypothetical protein [Pseudoxanthomonas sp.]WDS35314.1 MAG: hypothetical protein O8I58_13260 [Pseudoxanthomonas sp.]
MTHATGKAPVSTAKPCVFVAEAGGFLQSQVISLLLERGFAVRASLADMRGERRLRAQLAPNGTSARLELVPGGTHLASEWKHAIDGSEYVIQVATNVARAMPSSGKLSADEVGTTQALWQAARSKRAKCIAVHGMAPQRLRPARQTADVANVAPFDPTRDLLGPTAARPQLNISVPSLMGPLLNARVPGSMVVIERLLNGTVSRIPRLGYEIADVRDAASWLIDHGMAFPQPGASIDLPGTFVWMHEIAQILRRRFPQLSAAFPVRTASDFYVLTRAITNAQARRILPSLHKRPPALPEIGHVDGGAVTEWGRYSAKQTLIDAARSMLVCAAHRSQSASPIPDAAQTTTGA